VFAEAIKSYVGFGGGSCEMFSDPRREFHAFAERNDVT
jgi:hypothetical protein